MEKVVPREIIYLFVFLLGSAIAFAPSSNVVHLSRGIDTHGCGADPTALTMMRNVRANEDDHPGPGSDAPVWDPVNQIYVGGRIPDSGDVQALIEQSHGALPIFGYGSLCWNPGGILGDPLVTRQFGKAVGYQRCWCQKSTDHRGLPKFPGIVCTLLQDNEVRSLKRINGEKTRDIDESSYLPSLTEGVLYTVPPELVQACLEELDFREKGGYAREVISVVLDDPKGVIVQAALYRGTPDNPALWPRVLLDLVYAAAVCHVAVGPSGPNSVYLRSLHSFLERHKKDLAGSEDTFRLTRLVDLFGKERYQFYFLYGCGSNQHNQLLLESISKYLMRNDEAHELMELLLASTQKEILELATEEFPAAVYAGGGHSALLSTKGSLYLFGWNEAGQCGGYTRSSIVDKGEHSDTPPMGWLFPDVVQSCALGFAHSLILNISGTLYALGDNGKGQVTGTPASSLKHAAISEPVVPLPVRGHKIVTMAAGIFHSAAVTHHGQVIIWGGNHENYLTWTPPDGHQIVGVACGRKHTVAWSRDGKIWSWGTDNKYGQLGRSDNAINEPNLVTGPWNDKAHTVLDVQSGWSHTVVLAVVMDSGEHVLYGWGRNDKGQLGLGHCSPVQQAVRLDVKFAQSIACGSEYTLAVVRDSVLPSHYDTNIWACGWNEHGNLGISPEDTEYSAYWQCLTKHLRLVEPPNTQELARDFPVQVAAGGAHVLAVRVLEDENKSFTSFQNPMDAGSVFVE